MKKIAFLYPGQGAQSTGMGKDFYERSIIAKEILDEGSEILGIDLKKLCFEKNELLDRTDYTQIAMVSVCMAMTRELENHGIVPSLTAGLSLGEYAAICAAGGMSFRDALETVWLRGNLMHQAMQEGTGGMAAILGLTGEQVDCVIKNIDHVSIANYNCPGQIVITGETEAIQQASAMLKNAGAKRIMPLKVSGPFHSPFMQPAGEKLWEKLKTVSWTPLRIPYIANVNAKLITDIKETPELLKKQVSSSVLWEQSVRTMLGEKVDCYIEVGPGRTLAGFFSRIDRNVKVYSVSSMEALEGLCKELL